MSFNELRDFYAKNYSIGFLNPPATSQYSSFERKIVLIGLICYLYSKNKPKNPDLTYYSLIYKLSEKFNLPEEFIKALAIICEDFAYGCRNFPTFGFKGKDILKEIQDILSTYIPF